jgi:hypothetical protein
MSTRLDLVREPAAWTPPAELARLQRRALLVGGAAGVLGLAGAFLAPAQFFRAYLVAFLLVLGVPLGCLALVLLHHLTGGAWGFVIRRVPEAASRTLPLVALFFVPLAFGMGHLYEWSHPEVVAHDALLQRKAGWLDVPFFLGRAALCFALWIGIATLMNRWTHQEDVHWEDWQERRLRVLGSIGLVLFVLTSTVVAFDLLMSLDPHWFSTIYGLYLVGGQMASALAFVIVMGAWLGRREPLSRLVAPRHFDDYGKFLLTFLALWAYFAFSQYLIIWSANLNEEITWYVRRPQGGWRFWSPALVLLHFALPFALLLSKRLRRRPWDLAKVAGLVLVMRWADLYFQASPSWHAQGIALHWLDLVLPVALGGLWFAWFLRQLRAWPLVGYNDPHLQEVVDGH